MENKVKELENQIQQNQIQENNFRQNQFRQNQFEQNKRPLSRFDYEDDNDIENIQCITKKKKERILKELFMKKKVKKKKTK